MVSFHVTSFKHNLNTLYYFTYWLECWIDNLSGTPQSHCIENLIYRSFNVYLYLCFQKGTLALPTGKRLSIPAFFMTLYLCTQLSCVKFPSTLERSSIKSNIKFGYDRFKLCIYHDLWILQVFNPLYLWFFDMGKWLDLESLVLPPHVKLPWLLPS